jgi:hypothetical protein
MNPWKTPAAVAGLVAMLAGCTPDPVATTQSPVASETPTVVETPTPDPTPTPTPTPTPEWDADQQAAIDQALGYLEITDKIYADPSKYNEKKLRDALELYVDSILMPDEVESWKNGIKFEVTITGEAVLTGINASEPYKVKNDTAVEVTACRDESSLVTVRLGEEVDKSNFHRYVKYIFVMQQDATDEVFRMHEDNSKGTDECAV